MEVSVFNTSGQEIGNMELDDSVFAIEPHNAVMHQALVRQLANARQGTHSVKTRGQVRGTTAKWYRQKGTGRARHGARTAPIFVGGGVAHGPKPRKYTKKMPRKMRRLALRSALSVKAASRMFVVVDEFSFDTQKTKNMVEVIKNLGIEGRAVVLLPERNRNVELSTRNLADVKYLQANYLNVRDLLGYDYVIASKAAVGVIESFLGVEANG